MDPSLSRDLDVVARIEAVQKILEVVCRTTGMGFCAVARVTENHWVACAVRDEIAFGLAPGSELPLETTICNEIRNHRQPVVIDHVAADPAFCHHHTPKLYGFQSYISFPISLPDGRFFGTLCAIDPRPARLNTPENLNSFRLFAELIGMHLEAQDRMLASEAALLNERDTARLREQFIAVLGHDLRNPLNAIHSSAEVLRAIPHDPDAAEFLDIIQRGSQRMGELISNLLDFARGRLGNGISVQRTPDADLAPALQHVVTELQTASAGRSIDSRITIHASVAADAARIAQLLSNLLANALTHGDPAAPITVDARTSADAFELFVENRGPALSPEIRERLFLPFARASVRPGQQGLGLGLYIAAEIARAHRGKLSVSSTDGLTRFTFQMPRTLS